MRNESLQQQLDAQNDILASYQQPGTNTIAIGDSTGENPQVRATLTDCPRSGQRHLCCGKFARWTADQVYQLWIIRGDLP